MVKAMLNKRQNFTVSLAEKCRMQGQDLILPPSLVNSPGPVDVCLSIGSLGATDFHSKPGRTLWLPLEGVTIAW